MEDCGRNCFFAQIGKYLHWTKEDLLKAGSEELDTWKSTVIKCVEDGHWPNNAELCISLFYTNIYTNKVLQHQLIEWQPSHFRGFFHFLPFKVPHPENKKSDALQLSKMIFVPFLLVLACLLQSWNWCRRPWQARKNDNRSATCSSGLAASGIKELWVGYEASFSFFGGFILF